MRDLYILSIDISSRDGGMVPRQRGQRFFCRAYFGFHPLIMRKMRVSESRRKLSWTTPYPRQSSQKECPHGSLTGLVHSPRQMPQHSLSLVPSISSTPDVRSAGDVILYNLHAFSLRKAGTSVPDVVVGRDCLLVSCPSSPSSHSSGSSGPAPPPLFAFAPSLRRLSRNL